MTFIYTPSLIDAGLTYADYRQELNDCLAHPPVDDNAAKLRPRMQENIHFMDVFDKEYVVSERLRAALKHSPSATWVVIAEGWCTDAAFTVPMMAAIERAFPGKIKLRLFFRDANLDLMDANLTDGGRSIPKLIVLDQDLQEIASWGPRPSALNVKMKGWKEEGLTMKDIFPKMHAWYHLDATRLIQEELVTMLDSVSAEKV